MLIKTRVGTPGRPRIALQLQVATSESKMAILDVSALKVLTIKIKMATMQKVRHVRRQVIKLKDLLHFSNYII